jgi:hypothetical protein
MPANMIGCFIPNFSVILVFNIIQLLLDFGLKLITIEAQVQVVWKDFLLEKEGYDRIGVKFVDITLEAMEKLRHFLNTLMNSKISSFNLPSRLLSTLGISTFGDCAYLTPDSANED